MVWKSRMPCWHWGSPSSQWPESPSCSSLTRVPEPCCVPIVYVILEGVALGSLHRTEKQLENIFAKELTVLRMKTSPFQECLPINEGLFPQRKLSIQWNFKNCWWLSGRTWKIEILRGGKAFPVPSITPERQLLVEPYLALGREIQPWVESQAPNPRMPLGLAIILQNLTSAYSPITVPILKTQWFFFFLVSFSLWIQS